MIGGIPLSPESGSIEATRSVIGLGILVLFIPLSPESGSIEARGV